MKKALILVDLQNDFIEDGALEVPNGGEVVEVANSIQSKFDMVVATQDWHPINHSSFAVNHPGQIPGDTIMLNNLSQILWPVHCVQNTQGAAFIPSLKTELINKIFYKGTDVQIDSYSGFFDNGHQKATGLGDYLKEKKVTDVYILGLATDYCVKFTAMDAQNLGFNTYLIEDGCRGVELNPGDIAASLKKMVAIGIKCLSSKVIR